MNEMILVTELENLPVEEILKEHEASVEFDDTWANGGEWSFGWERGSLSIDLKNCSEKEAKFIGAVFIVLFLGKYTHKLGCNHLMTMAISLVKEERWQERAYLERYLPTCSADHWVI